MMLARIVPLIGFICLGVLFRWRGLLEGKTVEQLKWLIVHVLLPGVLFKTFLQARLHPGIAVIAAAVFATNILLYGSGLLLSRGLKHGGRYAPFLTCGMEYGMLGLALFTSLYGMAKAQYIAVIDLGHEFFFCFLFIPVKAILTSPINLGILAGHPAT